MAMGKSKYKRNSIRVEVFFPIGFKKIDKGTSKGIKDSYIQHKTNDREKIFSTNLDQFSLDINSRQFDKLDPGLVNILNVIVNKLDIVISMLSLNCKERTYLDNAICKDISSGGLLMYTPAKLAAKDIIEIRLEFPVFPPLVVVALGMVVNVSRKDKDYKVSVEFTAINNDDREEVIGYVFKRQRELLRRLKT